MGYCWSPNVGTGPEEWIRADLGANRNVVAIRTKGGSCCWVTQFIIAISTNGADWSYVAHESGIMVVFEGNTDATTIVSHTLPTPVETRFVQLAVTSIHGSEAELKWAIDGCPV